MILYRYALVTDKVFIYFIVMLMFKVLFMFTHAIQNNVIITFINNINNIPLTNVTVFTIYNFTSVHVLSFAIY